MSALRPNFGHSAGISPSLKADVQITPSPVRRRFSIGQSLAEEKYHGLLAI